LPPPERGRIAARDVRDFGVEFDPDASGDIFPREQAERTPRAAAHIIDDVFRLQLQQPDVAPDQVIGQWSGTAGVTMRAGVQGAEVARSLNAQALVAVGIVSRFEVSQHRPVITLLVPPPWRADDSAEFPAFLF